MNPSWLHQEIGLQPNETGKGFSEPLSRAPERLGRVPDNATKSGNPQGVQLDEVVVQCVGSSLLRELPLRRQRERGVAEHRCELVVIAGDATYPSKESPEG